MKYIIAMSVLILLIALVLHPAHTYCYYAAKLSVELDRADAAIFDSMMECKPDCELVKFEKIWQAREQLYRAWQEEASQCLG